MNLSLIYWFVIFDADYIGKLDASTISDGRMKICIPFAVFSGQFWDCVSLGAEIVSQDNFQAGWLGSYNCPVLILGKVSCEKLHFDTHPLCNLRPGKLITELQKQVWSAARWACTHCQPCFNQIQPDITCKRINIFLSDPGIPGVRSMGASVSNWVMLLMT